MNPDHEFIINDYKYCIEITESFFWLYVEDFNGTRKFWKALRSSDTYNIPNVNANIWGDLPQEVIDHVRRYYSLKAFW